MKFWCWILSIGIKRVVWSQFTEFFLASSWLQNVKHKRLCWITDWRMKMGKFKCNWHRINGINSIMLLVAFDEIISGSCELSRSCSCLATYINFFFFTILPPSSRNASTWFRDTSDCSGFFSHSDSLVSSQDCTRYCYRFQMVRMSI